MCIIYGVLRTFFIVFVEVILIVKTRLTLFGLIIFLVIGFASIMTNLTVISSVGIAKSSDFKVVFTELTVDGISRNGLINDERNQIVFLSSIVKGIEAPVKLEYEISNRSRNYDADVNVVCNSSTENVEISNTSSKQKIEAGSSIRGQITVSIKELLEEQKSITCEIIGSESIRDSLAPNVEIKNNTTLRSATGESDTYGFYSYRENIKKVVFEDSIVERDTPYSWDMSVAQDGSVISYMVEENGGFTVYI